MKRLFPGVWIYLLFLNAISLVVLVTHGVDSFGWEKLCQWDCGWYSSIVRNGYISSIPPAIQQPWDSNVAFFPLYPAIAWVFHRVFGLEVELALPVVSSFFALGVFILLSRFFGQNWKRMLLILAYPGTFYLFVSYSESLYLFFLLLGVLALRELKERNFLGILILLVSGFALGATRFSGFIIPGALFGVMAVCWVYSLSAGSKQRIGGSRGEFPMFPLFFLLGSLLGTGAFFAYSDARFGLWDLYFVTVERGWNKQSDLFHMLWLYVAALPFNFMPFIRIAYPMTMSKIITADLFTLYGLAIFKEFRNAFRMLRSSTLAEWLFNSRMLDFALLLGGAAHLFATALGDSGSHHRWMNGLRYSMPPFYLLVLLWKEEWFPHWLITRPRLMRGIYYALLVMGFCLEVYYLRLFTLGKWVS
jgi:hypothetical protein